MPRYIDADALLDKQEELLKHVSPHSDIAKRTYQIMVMLQTAPTISPDEVRGVGYNKLNEYHTLFQCSVCGWEDDDTITGSGETNTYNYCPNCGARMKGVSEDA